MLSSTDYRNCALTVNTIVLAVLVLCSAPQYASAQTKPGAPVKSPLCTTENAVDMIKQQAELTKTFSDPVRRIVVLIRAADLLWPHQPTRARAAFAEAFELAVEKEKIVDEKGTRSIILRMQKPDQRFIVIRAVAGRDSRWARELARQLFESTNDSEESAARSSFENNVSVNRLLSIASYLIKIDLNAALDLAGVSLQYPASSALARFLYQLAEVNQQAADQLYGQALNAYADKPMKEFLYLQAYPFAWKETLNTPIFSFYRVPPNFVTNQSLQRGFVQVLLRRAHEALDVPSDATDAYQHADQNLFPGKVHLLHGLMKLQPQVSASLPDLLPALTEAREKLMVSLSVETQELVLQSGGENSDTPNNQSFAEKVELALKQPNVYERDELITEAVMGVASGREQADQVIQAIDKISDSKLRSHLVEWFYFQRATRLIDDKQFEEAEKFAARVEGLELRAYLHTDIGRGLLSSSETQTRASEVLDEAIADARRAGNTIFAARTLLTVSSLYAKIDLSRSVSVLADAIGCINRIESADFLSEDQALEKNPRRTNKDGQYGGEYVFRFYMPGLDPESAFREMAKMDFDTALSQSTGLSDKFLRAMSILGIGETCLQQTQLRPKARSKKSKP